MIRIRTNNDGSGWSTTLSCRHCIYLLGNGSLYAGLLHLHLELVEEDPEELLHVVLHEAVQRLPTETLPSQQTLVERNGAFLNFLI